MNALRLKVVSVDDNHLNQEIIKESLENDFQVLCIFNTKDCLSIIAEFSPDVILLDLALPDINGHSLCRKLKQDPKTNGIPIIVITACNTEKERLQAYESGCDDFIGRPYEAEVLMNRIKNLQKHRE